METLVTKRIREYMTLRSLAIKDVAAILSVDRNTVSAYLTGRQKLKVDQLISLATAFHVNPCAFFMTSSEYDGITSFKERLDEKDRIIEEKDRLVETMIMTTKSLDSAIQALIHKINEGE